MQRFVEIQNFGVNFLTAVFFVTLFFTILQGYALIKQNRKIIKNRSGKSVSFIFFSYFSFSAIAIIFYGLNKDSLALTINGLVGFIGLAIIVNVWRFKKVSLKEKFIGFGSSIIIPIIILIPQKDELYLICGLIISGSLLLQVLEIWKNRDSGSVHPSQAIVSLFSSSFWLSYGFMVGLWPMKIINSLFLLLWLSLLLSYLKFKPNKKEV